MNSSWGKNSSSSEGFFFYILIYLLHVSMCISEHICHGVCVEVREQVSGVHHVGTKD